MSNEYLHASIKSVDDGGEWTAIASTSDLDRDDEVIVAGAFSPLPPSIPVHLDHNMSTDGLVGRAVPYYSGGRLLVDGKFAKTARAQEVRGLVVAGIVDSMSVGFHRVKRQIVDGVRTIIGGELLEASFVSVPSNAAARVLVARSYNGSTAARRAQIQAMLADLEEAPQADVRGLLAKAYADLAAVQMHDAKTALDRADFADADAALAEARSLLRDLSGPSRRSFGVPRPRPDGGRQWPPPFYVPGGAC